MNFGEKIIKTLHWSQKYTGTDMVYLATGSFWWILGKAGTSILTFITMIAFANWLSQESYGTYGFIVASLALIGISTLPGLNIALVKSIAQGKEGSFELIKKEKIRWGIVGSFTSLGVSAWYAFSGNELLAGAFLLGAFILPFKETFHFFTFFWNGKKRFDIQAKYSLASMGLSTLILIPTIYFTENILIILAVFLLGKTFFDWVFYRKTLGKIISDEKDPDVLSFGKSLTLINAIELASVYLDKIIIWKMLGAVPVAVYVFAKQPIEKLKELIPIMPLSLPKLGESKIDKKKKRGVVLKFLRLFIFTIPLSIILILTAPYLYNLIFPQYMESVKYFQALSLLTALSPFLLFHSSLIAEMRKKALYITNIGSPFLKILLFILLIPYLGIWGVVISILASELLRGLVGLYFFLKI